MILFLTICLAVHLVITQLRLQKIQRTMITEAELDAAITDGRLGDTGTARVDSLRRLIVSASSD